MRLSVTTIALLLSIAAVLPAEVGFDPEGVPKLPDNFDANIVAREPALMHPAALAFDDRGRLFVGGGPQFRRPTPDTPPDSIKILLDKDRDGVAEEVKTFATGFNSIQALAWHDGDLWVANAPDVTIIRDTDGDDRADEYVKVFTNLGHLRHGLHGFVWGPDGRLYMSQGNSQAQEGAPTAWRELMHIDSDQPDNQPLNKTYTPENYERDYIDKWPSAEGGFLRCRDMGRDLEIFARGSRNPWDWSFGPGFNWIATDNDPGPDHDRVMMPFEGAHFGMRHPWAYSWTGENNPATVPSSRLFPNANGSGVGVVYYLHDHFPEPYRDQFYIGDWTNNSVHRFRPQWDGALMTDAGDFDRFADGGEHQGGELSYTGEQGKPLFRPTDLAVGPGGALYVAGWGPHYGSKHAAYRGGDEDAERNWGRVFRIYHQQRPLTPRSKWNSDKRDKPRKQWSFDQLIADLGAQLPVWRTNAQEELVRRESKSLDPLIEAIESGELSQMAETWAVWTIGRIDPGHGFIRRSIRGSGAGSLNRRIQAIRILGDRGVMNAAEDLAALLNDNEPRIRLAAAQSLRWLEAEDQTDAIAAAAAGESDRLCFYTQWQALRALLPEKELRALLADERAGTRRAALLALLEDDRLGYSDVLPLAEDSSPRVAAVAEQWLDETGAGAERSVSIQPAGRDFREPITVKLDADVTGDRTIRYTLDGSKPTADAPAYQEAIELKEDATLKTALFSNDQRVGPIANARFHRITDTEWSNQLFVHDLRAESDRAYKVHRHGLQKSAELFTDRDYTYRSVPEIVRGATYVQTPNNDADSRGTGHLTFRVNQPVRVFVAHDNRAGSKPEWLTERFEDTGRILETTDVDFELYRRDYPAGEITLGGNDGEENAPSMYQVAVLQRSGAGSGQTTVAAAMAELKDASVERGEKLFFSRGTCFVCHELDGRGKAVGPDLQDLGLRAEPRYVVTSILKPNEKIIEGFLQATVRTTDGEQHFGMIRAESAKTLTLYSPDGREQAIPKKRIAERELLDQSAMPPSFPQILSPSDVADITAYLMTQKTDPDAEGEQQP